MFKVLEVHSAYISTVLAIIFHLIIGFYLLYILKITYEEYLPGAHDKRIVWYQAPQATKQPISAPAVYEQPLQQPVQAEQAPEYAQVPVQEVAAATVPLEVLPLRKGRSAEERRAAWSKKSAAPTPDEQKDRPLTAATLTDAISKEQAIKRQAHAVYTKEQAIKQGVAAQMREITNGRMRNKIFSALQIACSLNKKEYHSPMPVNTTVTVSMVFNQKGEIIAVEILKSTGTQALDEHIAYLLQSIKRIALPPSRNQELYTQTFTCRVTCPAGSGHFEFHYDEGSGIHVM